MSSPSPAPSGGAALLLLVLLGGLIMAASEPSLRQFAPFLLGALLLVGLLSLGGGGREEALPPPPLPAAPPALPASDWGLLTPRELEVQVAQMLSRLPGWDAQPTRGRADQGADVLAQGPGGVRVAVQVKRYRSAVGNAAVQAIVASKALYGCQHALVVTSGPGYTRAARELAQANGVTLWNRADLDILAECAERGVPLPAGMLGEGL